MCDWNRILACRVGGAACLLLSEEHNKDTRRHHTHLTRLILKKSSKRILGSLWTLSSKTCSIIDGLLSDCPILWLAEWHSYAFTVHILMLASPPAEMTFAAFSHATPFTPSLWALRALMRFPGSSVLQTMTFVSRLPLAA